MCDGKDTFNRTIVELKPNNAAWLALYDGTFNRTIVELKQGQLQTSGGGRTAFNRTIVELKQFLNEKRMVITERLLIEPLWN